MKGVDKDGAEMRDWPGNDRPNLRPIPRKRSNPTCDRNFKMLKQKAKETSEDEKISHARESVGLTQSKWPSYQKE